MTQAEMRQYLNRRIDELPLGLLGVVVEFVEFLLFKRQSPVESEQISAPVQSASPTIQRATNQPINPISRNSTGRSLLQFAGTWQGDDLGDCLQAVYDNRSEIETDPES